MAGGKIDILVEPDVKGFPQKLQSSLGPAIGVATKIGAGIGLALGGAALGGEIVKVGTDFQSQLNTMKAVSQATAAEMDQITQKARELGSDASLTATSAGDAAAAMTELAKGGFTVEESMTAAKGTLQLAAAAQTDAATAATIQSQALQAFSLKADQAGRVSDILAGAANASSAEIGDVALALQQAGTVSNQFGVSIDDTSTAIAMFANAGITGSDAGTLLKTALLALTDQGKPAQEAIEQLGLTVYNTEGKFVGLPSLFGQLNQAAARMTDEQYQAATATLFGSDAMRLAGIAASKGEGDFNKLKEAVTRQGQAAEVAAAQTQGLPGALERLNNTKEDVLLGIFNVLQDDLVKAADAGAKALEQIGPIAEQSFSTAARWAGNLIEGLTPVAGAVVDVTKATSDLHGPILGLAAALALSSWTNFPGKMSKGTAAVRSFSDEMKLHKMFAEDAGKQMGNFSAAVATLEDRGTAVGKLTRHVKDSAGTLITLGRETKNTATELSGLGKIATTTQGNIQIFSGVVKGAATGGVDILKGSAQGLMSMLGGPWGAALTAAGLAIGYLAQQHADAAQKEEEHKQYQDRLRDSLAQTTGAITDQTRELQIKEAEEKGWLETARQLGIEQGVIVDAMNGSTLAIAQVNDAVARSNAKAIEGNDFWKKYGEQIQAAGGNIDDFALALDGNAEATKKIKDILIEIGPDMFGVGAWTQWESISRGLQKTQEATLGLSSGVRDAGAAFTEAQESARRMTLEGLLSGEQLRQVMQQVGDAIISIPDSKTIVLSSAAPQIRKDLEALGAKVTDMPEGKVEVTFPNGLDIKQLLEEIGAKATSIEGGRLEITDNTQEVIDRLINLGVAVKDEQTGRVFITDNIATVVNEIAELRTNVGAGAQGSVTVSDNLQGVIDKSEIIKKLNGLQTNQTHTVTERQIKVFEQYNRLADAINLPKNLRFVDGGMVHFFAGGTENHVAQIAPAGSWRVWAEPETGGEAYIPLAQEKRARSTAILESVADRFGYTLAPKTNAGNIQYFANGAVVGPEDLLEFARGKTVNGQRASQPLEGAPYVWGGVNWGDCSGAMSALARFAIGLPAFAGRFATGSQRGALAAMGFQPGLGNPATDFSIGWFNGGSWGGHTSGTIAGTNVEMGGGRGNGQIGGIAAGAANSMYTDHAHLPLGTWVTYIIRSTSTEGISLAEATSGLHVAADGTITRSPHTKGVLAEGRLSADGTYRTIGGYRIDSPSNRRGNSVSWGEASKLHDSTQTRRARLYDTGGILPHGATAVNLSGRPERILSPQQTDAFDQLAKVLPDAAKNFAAASEEISDAMLGRSQSHKALASLVGVEVAKNIVGSINLQNFGGEFLGKTQVVHDAEKGLAETRKEIVSETKDITKAEEELKEARKELAEAEKEGGDISTTNRRKIEDAERALAKARKEGKADKIADAQRKLNRANEDAAKQLDKSEDKNANKVKQAREKVAKAEEDLTDKLLDHVDADQRLDDAERAVVAARITAAQNLVEGIATAASDASRYVAEFFDTLATAADLVEKNRQEISKLHQQQVLNGLEQVKAIKDLTVSEWDLKRVRADGAISVSKAEAELAEARRRQAHLGATSVEAMAGAMDRFRVTGTFAIEEIAESVVAGAAAVTAAEWGVAAARAQAAIDLQESTHRQAVAQLAVAETTLAQTQAAELLRLKTELLTDQTKQLYGLDSAGAKGASKGFGGLSQLLGGVGKLIGGAAAGAAGFATAGPVGAIAGAGIALSGLKELIAGGIDVTNNLDDIKKAWEGLGTGQKVGTVLGGLLGVGLGVGGGVLAQQYGPEAAVGGAELGAKAIDATLGNLAYGIESKMEKLGRDSEAKQNALQATIDAQKIAFELQRAQLEHANTIKLEQLRSQLDYADLQKQLAEAPTRDQTSALAEAARVAAQKREALLVLEQRQSQMLEQQLKQMNALAAATQQAAAARGVHTVIVEFTLPPGESFTRPQTEAMLNQIKAAYETRLAALNQVDANAYVNARI
ncbi:MAG: phage tail tape measure protein [Corynebacterium sp.]|nr:phage tail tape measure protein [Corynebacterium sp.]